MREIGFDHQHCTFHLLLNINEELREELKQIRKEYESNLKKQNPKLSETQIKKQSFKVPAILTPGRNPDPKRRKRRRRNRSRLGRRTGPGRRPPRK